LSGSNLLEILGIDPDDIPFVFWGFGVLLTNLEFHKPLLFLQPEDFWFSAPKKRVMVFALPGESGLTELAGDFKVHFHDRQGDFYLSVIQLRPQ
jgi:hypothetical protein